jgi:branched-chain amino acid transport system permease protein
MGSTVARRNIGHIVAGALCCGAAALPLSQYSLLTITWVGSVAIMLLGFNLVFGVSGQMVFSHSFFWAIGAYSSSVLLVRGWPFEAAIVVAVVVSMVLAWLFANILVQLEGFFLAIASFILPLIVPELAQLTVNYSGGSPGLDNIPLPTGSTHWYLALVLVVTVASLWIGRNLIDSPLGRSWRTIGTNEMVAQSVGIRPSRKKLSSFIASAFFAGLSGAFFAPIFGIISPGAFDLTAMLSILVGSVIGGAISPMGAVVGALLIVEVPQLLSGFAQNSALIYGLILLVALRLVPRGVAGGVNDLIYRYLILPAQGAQTKTAQSSRFSGLVRGLTSLATPPTPKVENFDLANHAYVPATERSGAGPAILECVGVSVRYGGVLAVDDISFTLAEGEFKAIIGPNGAGKSTLFNVFGGFAPIESGSILIDGEDVTYRPPDVRASFGVSRTFQETQAIGDLTAEESVLIGGHIEAQSHSVRQSIELLLNLPGHTRRERTRRQRAEELLELVGLGGLGSRRVADFPYGNQKLLQLARAMAARPRFLLLDEPAAGLSEVDCAELGKVLTRLRNLGIGILLVEHNVPFVISMCEHVMVMDHGKQIAQGTGAEILASPAVQVAYLGNSAASESTGGVESSTAGTNGRVGHEADVDPTAEGEELRNPIR